MSDQPVVNTDVELWREVPGDYYAPSIHVTAQGGIGINVGGCVTVMPLRKWYALAKSNDMAWLKCDEYRQFIEWIAIGPTYGPGAPTLAEQLAMTTQRAKKLLWPEG